MHLQVNYLTSITVPFRFPFYMHSILFLSLHVQFSLDAQVVGDWVSINIAAAVEISFVNIGS